jgi:hypothetical protein
MKKAVVVIGKHHAGKSLTIRGHLNPLLKISWDAHKFTLNGKSGWIKSQTLEESGLDVAAIRKYFHYDLLVFAARPESESGSKLNLLRKALQEAEEPFKVIVVNIQDKSEAPEKAKEIFNLLNSN